MVKKLFALASVSALAGIVSAAATAGCTTTTETQSAADSGTGTPDSGKTKPTPPDTDGGDEEPEEKTCISTKPVDVSGLPYKTAIAQTGACTADEAKALDKFLDDAISSGKTDFKQSEWAAVVSAGCAACAFTNDDAAAWGPILNDAKDPEAFGGYNFGACVELESGKESCGRAAQHFTYCRLFACSSKNCPSDSELSACLQDPKLEDEICKAAVDEVVTECGQNVNAYFNACKLGIEDRVVSQCVSPKSATPPQDAGDGGS